MTGESKSRALGDPHPHGQADDAQRSRDEAVSRRWHTAKRITWMVLITAAFLVYYLFDKLAEALSLLK